MSQVGSITSVPVDQSYTKPTVLSNLHKSYGLYKEGLLKAEELAKTVKDQGFHLSKQFERELKSPEPKFKNLIGGLEDFKVPATKENLRASFEPNHGRYKKPKPVAVGIPSNPSMKIFSQYQRGQITENALKEQLGDKFKLIVPELKNSEDGKFTKTASKVLYDPEQTNQVNTNPVHNSSQLFSELAPRIRNPSIT